MKKATLTWIDKTGQHNQVAIETKRFTIGRSKDNNLTINDPAISLHHALIEAFENTFQLTDCGSLTTFVNGKKIIKSQVLNSGDIILLGNTIKLTFGSNLSPTNITNVKNETVTPNLPENLSSKPLLSSPLIVMALLITVVLGLVGLLLVTLKPQKNTKHNDTNPISTSYPSKEPITNETPNTLPVNNGDDTKPLTEITPSQATDEQIERSAIEVMRRISNDDKPYIFPETALKDIKARIERYKNQTSLANNLATLNQTAGKFAILARQEGIEPALLFYVMLAQSQAGLKSDLASTAKVSLDQLVELRATFGSGLADGSLIIVAAYHMGSGTKKSHPLLATMRKVVKNPQTERNVWFLHERGGLSEDAYNFVLDFLVLGMIAQNPKLYGINTTALSY